MGTQVRAAGGPLARADPCIGLHGVGVVAVSNGVDKDGRERKGIPHPLRGEGIPSSIGGMGERVTWWAKIFEPVMYDA